MTTAFVDSSAWVALIIQRDSRHARARQFMRSLTGGTRLITSAYVVGESVTYLTYRHWRRQALELKSMIEAAIRINLLTLEWITPELHEMAWRTYERYDDQLFSFWDCTSFALCSLRAIDYVFGFDSDFRTAGFDLRPQ